MREPRGIRKVDVAHLLVDRHLRPDQKAITVGQLLDLRVQRLGADHGGAKLPNPAHQPAEVRLVQSSAELEVLLAQLDAAQIQQPAVELQATSRRHLDGADPAEDDVALEPPAMLVSQGQARAVQSRMVDRP